MASDGLAGRLRFHASHRDLVLDELVYACTEETRGLALGMEAELRRLREENERLREALTRSAADALTSEGQWIEHTGELQARISELEAKLSRLQEIDWEFVLAPHNPSDGSIRELIEIFGISPRLETGEMSGSARWWANKVRELESQLSVHAEAVLLERERCLAIIDYASERCDLSMQDTCALIARAICEGWTVEQMGERTAAAALSTPPKPNQKPS